MSATTTTEQVPPCPSMDDRSSGKDRFGEELGDDAHIWRLYDQVAKDDDEKRVSNWDRGLNNLALFAGLFSAVTTAFIIEARKDMQPDFAQLTFLVLNASAFGRPFVQEQFIVSDSARTVNCFWIASLMLSLTAAFVAIMGKDWIGMYSARPSCNPRQWAEIRTFRLQCVERWHMATVIATAPVLLHISLILFGAGLVMFISGDAITHRLTLCLSATAGGLYLVTVLSAVCFSTSPFQSPATQAVRRFLLLYVRRLRGLLEKHPLEAFRGAVLVFWTALRSIPMSSLDLMRRMCGRRWWRRRSAHARQAWHLGALEADVKSWRDCIRAFGDATVRFVRSGPALLHYGLDELRYRRQRPRTRPSSKLTEIFLSTRWTDIPCEPTPEVLAESLDWLSQASPAPGTLRSMIFALGDLSLGSSVANCHASRALCCRINHEIHHNWNKVDFDTFARYMLANVHIKLWKSWDNADLTVCSRFPELQNPSLWSETVLAALFACNGGLVYPDSIATVREMCQNAALCPRAITYLLSTLAAGSCEEFLLLVHRGWDYLRLNKNFNITHEFQRHLLYKHRLRRCGIDISSMTKNDRQERDYFLHEVQDFTGGTGAIELLCFFLQASGTRDAAATTAALDLIAEILRLDALAGIDKEHPCIVYIFGGVDMEAVWQGRRRVLLTHGGLRSALPMSQYRCSDWAETHAAVISSQRIDFDAHLVRIVIRLLSPSEWCPSEWWRSLSEHGTSDLELYVRCVHFQLCHPNSLLRENEKEEVIDLTLKQCVLITASAIHDYRLWDILAAISRRIHRHLRLAQTQDEGIRLLRCFISSHVKRLNGSHHSTWDLEQYIRQGLARLSSESHRLREMLSAGWFIYEFIKLLPFLTFERHHFWATLPSFYDEWLYFWDIDLALFFDLACEPERVGTAASSLWDWDLALDEFFDEPVVGPEHDITCIHQIGSDGGKMPVAQAN